MPAVISSSFSRPANTTAYTSGDLVADNTTAGSVTPLTFSLARLMGQGTVVRVRAYKSSTTATAATFTLYLFRSAQTLTNGDNGAFAVATVADLVGSVALDMSSGGLAGTAGLAKQFAITGGITVDLANEVGPGDRLLYGYLTVGGAYNPASAETFTITLEVENGT